MGEMVARDAWHPSRLRDVSEPRRASGEQVAVLVTEASHEWGLLPDNT